MRILKLLRFQFAWCRWFLGLPGYKFGDPTLGSGDLRNWNREIIKERYNKKEPKRADYGL